MIRLTMEAFKEALRTEWIRNLIDPADNCFRCSDGSLVALRWFPERSIMLISAVEGRGLGWVRELRKAFIETGVKRVVCLCREDSPLPATLYKYLRYRLLRQKDPYIYPDGTRSLMYFARVFNKRFDHGRRR